MLLLTFQIFFKTLDPDSESGSRFRIQFPDPDSGSRFRIRIEKTSESGGFGSQTLFFLLLIFVQCYRPFLLLLFMLHKGIFTMKVWGANAATQDDAQGESEAKRSRSGVTKAVTRTPLQV